MTTAERIYRLLLKAYPASYRHEYEEPMAQHFRDQLRAATSAPQRLRFWLRIVTDLTRTVPIRHLENWLPRHSADHLTDEVQRAFLCARHEAGSFSQPAITLEHLLLGLLRSDEDLQSAVKRRGSLIEVAQQIEKAEAMPRQVPTMTSHRRPLPSEGLPLSQECKQVLSEAIKEATKMKQRVSTKHLVSAMLQQDSTLAAQILRDCGIKRSQFDL